MLNTVKKFIILGIGFFIGCVPVNSAYGVDMPDANALSNKDGHILEECRNMVQNLGDDAIKTLKGSKENRKKREEQFRPLFVKNFDVERIGKFVLGRYGRGNIKPEEFQEFLEIFQKTIVSIYANRLGNYDDEKFVVKEASFSVNKPEEKMVNVKSHVISKDKSPINIVWTIVVKDGHKGIVDVTIEGVSQAFTQRQEYADTLNNGGIRELIKKLQKKYDKNMNAN